MNRIALTVGVSDEPPARLITTPNWRRGCCVSLNAGVIHVGVSFESQRTARLDRLEAGRSHT